MRLDQVILRTTRATQPLATAVPPGALCFVLDEHKTERSSGSAWEDVTDVTSIPPPPVIDVAALHLRTTRGAQPVATTVPVGTLCFVSDENKTERSNGSAWQTYSDVTPPPAIPTAAGLHQIGTRAAQPVASSVAIGTVYYVSNEGKLERSSGSAWQEFSWLPDTGTFTPILTFGGAATGIVYATQFGRYLALGPWVAFNALVELTSKGTATGNNLISGFPFTDAAMYYTPIAMQAEGMAGTGTVGMGAIMLGPWAGANAGGIEVVYSSRLRLTDANFSNTSRIALSGLMLRTTSVPW